ncbi:hypothetical protein KY362_04315, partial [Candidatus Woesearchaeota archaeon]|nr:hypothetical protein [Candidatus Woesearchaeota archaeon]
DDIRQMLKNLVWGLGGGVGYLIRLIIDEKMREHEIKNAPEVIKVLTKALATKGKSLLNPKELAVIFRYAFTNPNAPPTLQQWARRMVTEKKIENLFSKESGLLDALKNDMRQGSRTPPPAEGR